VARRMTGQCRYDAALTHHLARRPVDPSSFSQTMSPVQFVFVVQSTVGRRRTAAILSVVEVVADLPDMVETMRAVS